MKNTIFELYFSVVSGINKIFQAEAKKCVFASDLSSAMEKIPKKNWNNFVTSALRIYCFMSLISQASLVMESSNVWIKSWEKRLELERWHLQIPPREQCSDSVAQSAIDHLFAFLTSCLHLSNSFYSLTIEDKKFGLYSLNSFQHCSVLLLFFFYKILRKCKFWILGDCQPSTAQKKLSRKHLFPQAVPVRRAKGKRWCMTVLNHLQC